MIPTGTRSTFPSMAGPTSSAADKRGTGFGIQAIATGILFVGALIGVIGRIAHIG
jgi:hypothetical protein